MAGHSKWANTKRRKGAQDAIKARKWTRILRLIPIAIQEGGSSDPDLNPRLRLVIQNAKGANIPKVNISRALQKASGQGEVHYTTATYEGYGPRGIAVLVETMTDNAKRTISDVRAVFNKYGGQMIKNGSLAHLFSHQGLFELALEQVKKPEELLCTLIEAGAETFEEHEQAWEITCPKEAFGTLGKKLEAEQLPIQQASLAWLPHNRKELPEEATKQVYKFLEALEEVNDVQALYHDLDLAFLPAQEA